MQISIDGYVADTNGNTSWMIWDWVDDWAWDNELRKYHIDLTTSSDCILLSRKMATQGFVDHWDKIAENPANPQYAFAMPISKMRKVVFSKKLNKSIWKNTELAKGNFVHAINQLKDQEGKDIIVYGGATFVASLIKVGLIDEFHLFINPTALGNGMTIFKEVDNRLDLTLSKCKSFDCGVVVLTYESKR